MLSDVGAEPASTSTAAASAGIGPGKRMTTHAAARTNATPKSLPARMTMFTVYSLHG